MKRTLAAILCAMGMCGLTSGQPQGAMVGPGVRSALESLGTNEEVSVIVHLSDRANIEQFRDMPRAARRRAIIRELRDRADSSQASLRELFRGRGVAKFSSLWLINGMSVEARGDVIRELENDPRVAEIELDYQIPLYKVVYSSSTVPEWNIDAIHAKDLWGLGFKGQRVVVASMDTGVDLTHPDIKARWRGGANSWFDPYTLSTVPYDPIGHGTETMGVMVGGSAGGTAIGVAPSAKWIAVKIFNDSGSAQASAIHRGFQWLVDPDSNPDTDDAPDVVNNSWGSVNPNGCSEAFLPDIEVLKAAGIAVVFAAGNDGPNPATSSDPANNTGVFSVGATNRNSLISSFSSRGPSACDGSIFPLVVAPGTRIKSSSPGVSGGNASYSLVNGTSFAAPHAAGAMALLLSAFPGLTVEQLEQALISSALDLGDPDPDNTYGNGLINVMDGYFFLVAGTTEVSLDSQAPMDGWVRELSAGAGVGGSYGSRAALIVGDNAQNDQYKSILSFDTGSIPASATVTSAKLTLWRKKALGTNPFKTHGPCYVDIVNGTFNTPSVEKTDFEAAPTSRKVAALSNPRQDGVMSSAILNEVGLRSINKGGITQLKVYFKSPSDSNNRKDAMVFWGDDASPQQRPKLIVTYK
jgi:serine protease AprX